LTLGIGRDHYAPMDTHHDTSVVVVPRERFGSAIESLECVLSTMPAGTRLTYVDAGSPPPIARQIARAAVAHDFLLLRTDRHLAPNEARNLALPFITTGAVAFVDNDVMLEPGWLERLAACAEATGAWLVTPIIAQRGPDGTVTHMAGGDCRIVDDCGRRRFHEEHRWLGRPLEELLPLERQRTEFIEFHCVLVTRPALDVCFPLDEQLRSNREHCDLSLQVQGDGGEIWLEPSVIVTQLAVPRRLPISDRRYYAVRWSDVWNRASMEQFREKWSLDPSDPAEAHDIGWLTLHRLFGNRGSVGSAVGGLPSRPRRVVTRVADRGVQTLVAALDRARPRRTPSARVVHGPEWSRVAEPGFHG
jgi:Glycosyl transferase family 2